MPKLALSAANIGSLAKYIADGSPAATAAQVSPAIPAVAATAGAATLNALAGKVTSEAITTAAAATYTLTLTNALIAAGDIVLVSLANGTNTQGIPVVGRVTPANGSVVVTVTNLHASQALNGTIVVAFQVTKAGV